MEGVGACKVVLPSDVIGPSKPVRYTKKRGFYYSARLQDNGTYSLRRTERNAGKQPSISSESIPTGKTAAQHFEELIGTRSGLASACYCVDMDAEKPDDRESFGLPMSPIWPLKGDHLPRTIDHIPGIHGPFVYEALRGFAPFAMHVENADLYSVNYLWDGEKHWTVIPEDSRGALEAKSRETNNSYYSGKCAQFLQHSATYYPSSILQDWGISYHPIQQKAGEAVITFPGVYHQGFSNGPNFAEAVNYADENWSINNHRGCNLETCPPGSITNDMLVFQEKTMEQISEDNVVDEASEENANSEEQNILPKRKRAQCSHGKNSAKEKRRKVSQNKPGRDALSFGVAQAKAVDARFNKKIEEFFRDDVSTHFQNLTPIPKDMKQPTDIYLVFARRCPDALPSRVGLLTRLFFAVGSPDAFYQLHDACRASREGRISDILQPTNDISQIIQALDRVETTLFVASILRRFYLSILVDKRHKLEELYQKQRPRRPRGSVEYGITNLKQIAASERSSVRALDEMMKEAYPDIKPTRPHRSSREDAYIKSLSSLRTRLRHGSNWYTMQQIIPGALALIPTASDYGIQNRE